MDICPNYLIVELNFRSQYRERGGLYYNFKSKQRVVVDKQLTFAGNIILNLTCIICHSGTDVNSGHYVNYVKQNDKWFKYDDELVTEIKNEKSLLNRVSAGAYTTAYILLYSRGT